MNILYDAAALSVAAAGGFTGTAALSVPAPTFAASGTVVNPPISGTAALTVPMPSFAASGTVFVNITGTVSITVPVPSFAASGTQFLDITGTVAIIVLQPTFSATGSISGVEPPAVGGRPHGRRRAVVHRYPERKAPRIPVDAHPLYGQLVPIFEGAVSISVTPPRFRARGLVTTVAEIHEERAFLSLVDDDEDLALALTLADTWMT